MKRPAGDYVFGKDPVCIAIRFDGLARNNHKELMRHHAEKIRSGLSERVTYRQRIESLNANIFGTNWYVFLAWLGFRIGTDEPPRMRCRFEFKLSRCLAADKRSAGVVSLCVQNGICDVGILCRQFRVQSATQRPDKIFGSDRVPIGKARRRPQMKRELSEVAVNVPLVSDSRIWTQRLGIVDDESFIERHINACFHQSRADLRIHRLWLRPGDIPHDLAARWIRFPKISGIRLAGDTALQRQSE